MNGSERSRGIRTRSCISTSWMKKDTLLGVVDLKEVLKANVDDKLADIMTTNVIHLGPENTLLEASEMFSRYSFRAIPVTDDNNIILGVIPYRDIMNLKHRFV